MFSLRFSARFPCLGCLEDMALWGGGYGAWFGCDGADALVVRYTNADHWDGFRNFLLHNT